MGGIPSEMVRCCCVALLFKMKASRNFTTESTENLAWPLAATKTVRILLQRREDAKKSKVTNIKQNLYLKFQLKFGVWDLFVIGICDLIFSLRLRVFARVYS